PSGVGGSPGTGGAGTGGSSGTGGAGTGGAPGTGGAGIGGAIAGTGGTRGTGGSAGTGGAPGVGGATTVVGDAACTGDGWCWVFPLPHGNYLRGVWGSSSSDVWAVGDGGTLMHWDGARWATTLGSTQGRWYGLWGSAANDVWVVGLNGRNAAVQRFDGTAWHAVAIATTSPLTAVWGTGTGAVFVGVGGGGGVWRSD